jgi:hypothetical protein
MSRSGGTDDEKRAVSPVVSAAAGTVKQINRAWIRISVRIYFFMLRLPKRHLL